MPYVFGALGCMLMMLVLAAVLGGASLLGRGGAGRRGNGTSDELSELRDEVARLRSEHAVETETTS